MLLGSRSKFTYYSRLELFHSRDSLDANFDGTPDASCLFLPVCLQSDSKEISLLERTTLPALHGFKKSEYMPVYLQF